MNLFVVLRYGSASVFVKRLIRVTRTFISLPTGIAQTHCDRVMKGVLHGIPVGLLIRLQLSHAAQGLCVGNPPT